jgi:hypothetical protein
MTASKPAVNTMSLEELYALEQGIETRKRELLADFDCLFVNTQTQAGYAASLDFAEQPEFVICLATDTHGHRRAWHICQPNEVTHQILAQKIKKHTYETGAGLTLTKLEVVGVTKKQLQMVWEANLF